MKLFKIEPVENLAGRFTFKSRVEPLHSIFEGHFPQNPVVPGVCTMGMVKECCEMVLMRQVRYSYVKEVKFLLAIIPTLHSEVMVDIEFKEVENQTNIDAKVLYDDKVMMKLKAVIV